MTIPIAYPWMSSGYPTACPSYLERRTNTRGIEGLVYFDPLKNIWASWCPGDESFNVYHKTKEEAVRAIDGLLASRGIYLL